MGLPPDHPLRLVTLIPFTPDHGVASLGLPVDFLGGSTQGGAMWAKEAEQTRVMLQKLRQLPDGQTRHCLLRHCLDACRVNHLMRGTAGHVGKEARSLLSDELRTAVGDLVGSGLPSEAWEQAALPISHGGPGIRDPETTWPEARMAALSGFHIRAGSAVWAPPQVTAHVASDTQSVISELASTLGPHFDPLSQWTTDVGAVRTADKTHASQHW